MDEERLLGGNTHADVVRVADTVRRPTGFWTPGVAALLHHLQTRGYESAPRHLGTDEQGREILTFVPGSVVWPDHFALVATDEALAQVAATIRRYHDAVAEFPHEGFTWSDRGADPRGPHEVLCHNDLAPWNLVHSPSKQWTFIDWDLAAPGRLAWDLSLGLLSFVPLMADSTLDEAATRHRISVFATGYGKALPANVLAVAVERCAHEADRIERFGTEGIEPYARLLADGHLPVWRAAATHIAAHQPSWQAAVDATVA